MNRFVLVPICLMFAACAQPQHATAPEIPTVDPSLKAEPAPEPTAEVDAEMPPPPLPPEKPDTPSIALEDLVGLQDDVVVAMIGEPDLRQNRAPAMAWIYERGACRFGLLLYPDLETDRRTVLSYETDGDASCSAQMVAQ